MRSLRNIKGLVITLFLFTTLLLCNVLQMLSIVTYPFSKETCWAINRQVANFWWGLVAWTMENVIGIKIHVVGDELPMHENAIILPNHQSTADIPALLWLAWKKGMVGNIKWFVKDGIKWIPGVGWGLWLLGSPFLKRDWQKDKPAVLTTLGQYKTHRVPIWMISFLEGTRSTKEKLIADGIKTTAKGLVPLKYHLYPKKAGIVATIQGLRSHVKAIYDVEILYHDSIPGLWQMVTGQALKITLRIVRTPIEDIPKDDHEIFSWVENVFRNKDLVMDSFQDQPF